MAVVKYCSLFLVGMGLAGMWNLGHSFQEGDRDLAGNLRDLDNLTPGAFAPSMPTGPSLPKNFIIFIE